MNQNQDHSQNAMTEIALALAMAFFAIMVLAMVSMGTQAKPKENNEENNQAINLIELLAPAKPSEANEATSVGNKDIIIFFNAGVYYNQELIPLSAQALAQMITQTGQSDQQIILALSPDLSMQQALQAQQDFNATSVRITLMDEAWQQTFRSLSK